MVHDCIHVFLINNITVNGYAHRGSNSTAFPSFSVGGSTHRKKNVAVEANSVL